MNHLTKNAVPAFIVLGLMVFAFAKAGAQDESADPSIKGRISEMRKAKIVKFLELTPEQAAKFSPVYDRQQEQQRTMKKDIASKAKALNKLTRSGSADQEIAAKAEDLRTAIRKMWQQSDADMNEIKSVLTTKQYARYVAFEIQFREALQKAALKRAGRGMKNRR